MWSDCGVVQAKAEQEEMGASMFTGIHKKKKRKSKQPVRSHSQTSLACLHPLTDLECAASPLVAKTESLSVGGRSLSGTCGRRL